MGTDSQMAHSYWIVHNYPLARAQETQAGFNSLAASNCQMASNYSMARMQETQAGHDSPMARLQEIQMVTKPPTASNYPTDHKCHQMGGMQEAQMGYNSWMAEMLLNQALQVASYLWAMIVAVTCARTSIVPLIHINLVNNHDEEEWNSLIWNENQLAC